MSEIVAVGCGQIGLPFALAFCEAGASVLGVDIDPARLDALVTGRLAPDHEGLSPRLRSALSSGALSFAAAPRRTSGPCTFIITVPTPVDGGQRFVGEPLRLAVDSVLDVAVAGDLIVICSTVPIGTTRALARASPVGGPCLSKDVFLLERPVSAEALGIDLLLSVRNLNQGLARRLCADIAADLDAFGRPRRVAVLGLAFKGHPVVSDRAYSFGVDLAAALSAHAPPIAVTAWDPAGDADAGRRAALKGASIVVLANDHPALADLADIASEAPDAVVYDLCGIADRASAKGLTVRVFGDGASRR